jgi:hypothetical protein
MSIKPAGICHQDFVLIAPNAAKHHSKAPTSLTAPANTSKNYNLKSEAALQTHASL